MVLTLAFIILTIRWLLSFHQKNQIFKKEQFGDSVGLGCFPDRPPAAGPPFGGNRIIIVLLHLYQKSSGAEENRTPDLMLAKHALSQLSYCPETFAEQISVGPRGLEPLTPALSARCSTS